MSERLRVARRALTYPADAASLAILRKAGGLSKVAPEDRKQIVWKRASVGDFCDDMPPESIEHYVTRGDVVRVTVPDAAPVRAKRAKAVTDE